MTVKVEPRRCPQNHRCPAIKACPVDVLRQKGFEASTVDEEKCIDCGQCVMRCPMGTLQE